MISRKKTTTPSVSKELADKFVVAASVYPLARLIQQQTIDPGEIRSPEQFAEIFLKVGTEHDNAFQIHVDSIPREIALVGQCLKQKSPRSAIVLLFTLIEGEINSLIRIHLSLRDFTQAAILDAQQGTDFDCKMDVLLPLLGVTVPARLRNTASQSKSIRNTIVHNKAAPQAFWNLGGKESDEQRSHGQALRFFDANPLERIEDDLTAFWDTGSKAHPAIQEAISLLTRFYVDTDG